MKSNFTKLIAALTLLVFMTPSMVMWGQMRTEVVAYTLDGTITGGDSGYATESSITQDEISWKVTGNTTMSPWRIGGKSISEVERPVYSTDAISDNITKIEVEHGTASGITVNSWTVIVASDANFSNVVSTLTPDFTANATTTINRPTGADWTNCYYKFIYNVTVTQTSNRFVQFVEANFYKQEGSGTVIATPTFSPAAGTYTETQSVTISCETENSTIYYTIDGSTPDNTSTQYNGAITVSGTTTINAIAYVGTDASSVASATYTIVNLEHAGTEADPYTVADAHTAIDANVGFTNVYATGIVSAIPTAYNSTYGNVTFNMVDEEGDEVFLQAYRCTGNEAADVTVGDVVVVCGNLIKYGSTYEFGQGCQLVSLTHPVVIDPTITVTPATINAPAEGADGTLAIAYENIEDLISFDIQFCDANGNELEGDDPDWIYAEITEPTGDEGYTVSYIIDANDGEARNAYFKVYTFVGEELEEVYSNLVTVSQEEYVAPTYAELPFSFNAGRDAIENTDGLYQDGLGTDYNASTNPNTQLKFDGTGDWLLLQFDERPGTLTFDIKGNSFSGGTFKVQTSENGTTYIDLAEYTELGDVDTKTFDNLGENVRYIKWLYYAKSNGNVGLGNITLAKYEAPVASITVDPNEVNMDANEHEGTLALTYLNLTISELDDFDIQYYDDEEQEIEEPDWIEVTVAEKDPSIGDGYVVSYYMIENDDEARTTYFKVFAAGDEDFVYSNLVTVNQAAPVTPPTPGNWVLTPLSELTSADVFIIVGDNGDNTYAMTNDNGTSSAPAAVGVAVAGNTLTGTLGDDIQWNVVITDDGYMFYPAGNNASYLYCTNANNGVRVGTGDAKHFTLDDSGYLTTTETNKQRYIGIYNSQDWRCYENTTGNIAYQTFAFYKKVSDVESYTTNIDACYNNAGGYYLIASPVASFTPSDENGFKTSGDYGDYDLYYFDQTNKDKEWRNYKKNNFDIVSGKGYLYASQNGTTLTFEGQPYYGNGIVPLSYDENAADKCKGWNLIGNPYNTVASITQNYYIINPDGRNDLIAASSGDVIGAMEGIFVKASEEGEYVTFEPGSKRAADSRVVLNINDINGKLVDRAIVRFDEGGTLPKFMINEDHTQVYIPQDNHRYAVVSSDGNSTMPVNIKAAEMGKYTISISLEGVDMDYLHLIDRFTGEDVNLLIDNSYSFVASNQDMESRFILSFTTNGYEVAADEPFAYQNGSEIIVNGEGELQIFDIMGRLVKTNSVNGVEIVNLNTQGVYVFTLNGLTQKIVVR